MIPAAQAQIVNPGTDYLRTPRGGSVFCYTNDNPCTLPLSFNGMPIGTPTASPPDGGTLGQADTVVNRLDPVDPTASNMNSITHLADIGGNTDIEIIGLSLEGTAPVYLSSSMFPGVADGTYKYYAGLQKYYPNTKGGGATSTGTMFIGNDPLNPPTIGAKTWDSTFDIKGVVFFIPTTTVVPEGNDFVRTVIEHFTTVSPGTSPQACNNTAYSAINTCMFFTAGPFKAFNYPWDYIPLPDQIIGADLVGANDNNFYLSSLNPMDPPPIDDGWVLHEAPTHNHTVTPRLTQAPSPLGILGFPAVALTIGRLRKLSSSLGKAKSAI